MSKSLILSALPLMALAACHAHVDVTDADDNASDGNVHVAMSGAGPDTNKVSVNVPGFSANVSLPNMNLGGHIDLDGIKLAPETKIGNFDVTAHDGGTDKDEGKVRLSFTNPAAPMIVIDHYARSAADAGYANIVRTATSLTATKGAKTFGLDVTPQGSGSQGTITVAGEG